MTEALLFVGLGSGVVLVLLAAFWLVLLAGVSGEMKDGMGE